MSEPPSYPSAPDPDLPPSAATPPPTPPYGGYGTPPPPPPAPPAYGTPGGPYGGPPAYDVMAAVSYGWAAFRANAGTFLVLALLAILVPVAISIAGELPRLATDDIARQTDNTGLGLLTIGAGGLLGFVVDLVAQAVALFFGAAMIRASFDVLDGRRAELSAAFRGWDLVQVLLLGILTSLGTSVGVMLCVLPGVAFLFFTWFASYFVVSGGQHAIDGIVSSFRFALDHIGDLILLFLLSAAIFLVGVCACGLGLFVALPVTTVAAAYSFRVLQGQPVAAV